MPTRFLLSLIPVLLLAAGASGGGEVRTAFVVLDLETGERTATHEELAAEPLPPCSSFKVWHSLIGLDLGVVGGPDEPFYNWDGVARAYKAWNRDLTLEQAFRASCVPAFQGMARRIGAERMGNALARIGYGDLDISAGQTEFWLPREDRKTILISPDQQVALLGKLLNDGHGFRSEHVAMLRGMMHAGDSGEGSLFGKTGSGFLDGEAERIGWYIGWVETGQTERAFACVQLGPGVSGSTARQAAVEELHARGWY